MRNPKHRKKIEFYIVWRFLKINIFRKKLKFLPFLPRTMIHWAETFLMTTSIKLGCVLFLFERILFWWILAYFKKFGPRKTIRFFVVAPVFWLSLAKNTIYFYKTKNTHPDLALVATTKTLLGERMNFGIMVGGKLQLIFSPCVPYIP
jgi:hypothetical protein